MTGSYNLDLTQPVTEQDHIQGPRQAPLILLVYGDYECPYTRRALNSIKQQREQFNDRLCFVFRNFPLYDIHPHALIAAEAAEAAAAQGSQLFWEMHTYLFDHQKALEGKDLRQYAALLGLDLARYDRDMLEHAHADRIKDNIESGLASGVAGTPTIFINRLRYDGSWEFLPLQNELLRSAGVLKRQI
jgi:protein-disulfide isomerase